ncbi:vanadium-dependent haloperoxidase [Nostoc sp. 'Lobaria pulmonaria (5183) cyanobiont']|uniref:vanadium-dependent haloperoxidase n=1 Tax=Nostoc sp. 'Lobaria pulmonaria (5183) cyanobiont' TaxID=1618022 RepID=UPI000CF30EB7|nr:vanadium-dependent haloperoxidase [Nostoc sp. 'Lobaria pulmonaria (5183) cyanobiont']
MTKLLINNFLKFPRNTLLLEHSNDLKKYKPLPSLIPLGVAVVGVFFSLPVKAVSLTADNTTNNVFLWNSVAFEAIRATRPGPTISGRSLAMMSTSMFDAWAAYDPVAIGTQLGGTFRRPQEEDTIANKNETISYAAYKTLVDLFPIQKPKFDNLMTSLGYNPTNNSTNTSTAAGIGNVAAQALLNFRHYDGSNQLGDLHPGSYSDYTGYTPVNDPDRINDPDRWQPQRVTDSKGNLVVQKFLTPYWGNVTPFALTSGSQFRPTEGPKSISSDPDGYKKQAQEILDISANLTDKQKVIAEYWADTGWAELSEFVSKRDHHSVDDDVKMLFALNNANFDATIAAWDTKRAFDSVRPITAIHELFKGQTVKAWGGPNQGTQEINGENWRPYISTPSFAEYVSGHSTASSAAAEVLKLFTGSDAFGLSHTFDAGTSLIEKGPATDVTLSWDTFSDAAEEAGISRLYGGIHFKDGHVMGEAIGRLVGAQAWEKAQTYISPKAVPEPSSIFSLLGLGALGLGSALKRKQPQKFSLNCKQ